MLSVTSVPNLSHCCASQETLPSASWTGSWLLPGFFFCLLVSSRVSSIFLQLDFFGIEVSSFWLFFWFLSFFLISSPPLLLRAFPHQSSLLLFFFFVFLGPQLQHMEVPRLGVELELKPLAYTTAMAMPDPSHICDLHHSSWQC